MKRTVADLTEEIVKFITRKGAFEDGREVYDLSSKERQLLADIAFSDLEEEILKRANLKVTVRLTGCWLLGYSLTLIRRNV